MKYQKISYRSKPVNLIVLFLILINLFPVNSFSQDIKKDVTVVKPYEPTVTDATKLNQMPVFNDTATVTPKFNYSIIPTKLTPSFQPRLVSAAKMVPESVNQLYKTYINLGIGNPTSPLAEMSITNLRSHENAYGLYLRYHSADGNIKLENNSKSEALYSDYEAQLYGKHIAKKYIVTGNVGYLGNKINFYGYNPDIELVNTPTYHGILQQYNLGTGGVSVESTNKDSSKMYYRAGTKYDYFGDKFKFRENHFNFEGEGSLNTKSFYAGLGIKFDHFSFGKSKDSLSTNIFSFNPWISKSKGNWKYFAGVVLTSYVTSDNNKTYFYPKAGLEFQVAPSILTTYVGVDGYLDPNNYQEIAHENPYIRPGSVMKPTSNQARVYGGFKGEFISSLSYNLYAAYSAINNQYFFINDTLAILGNDFIPVYDDIDVFNFMAELTWRTSEKLTLYGKANLYKYTTFFQKPWQLPNFDMTLSAKYNLQNKILVYADLYAEGARYAPKFHSTSLIKMNSFADLNLKLEYQYSKVFSFYLQFKNLTAAKYQIWSQFPVYRFQVMGGLTYSL